MTNYLKTICCLLLGVLIAVQGTVGAQDATEPRAIRGGMITITVKNIPEEDAANVNGQYNVSVSDGTIALPYLSGRISVAGKTSRQIEDIVRSQYLAQKIYQRPIVQAIVANTEEIEQAMARYVTVSGYVNTKRNVRYRPGMTLLEAILECGDISDYGSRRIQVTRRNVTRTYDYFSAADRGLKLQADDKIFVQKRGALESRPSSIGR